MRRFKLFFIFGIIISLLSCGNLNDTDVKNSDKTEIKISVNIAAETDAARTVLPMYSTSNLKDIVLSGKKNTASEYIELKKWDSYSELVADNILLLDSDGDKLTSTWNFKLSAKSADTLMTGTCTLTLSETNQNLAAFTLAVDPASEQYGEVEISFYTSYSFTKVTATWESDSEVELTEADGALKFNKSKVSPGNYKVAFKFYYESQVMFTYPTYVIVEAGAISKSVIRDSDLPTAELSVVQITYDYNNGSGENCKQKYYASDSLLSASGLTVMAAPIGKKFRGWNTQADGKGTRYSAYTSPKFTQNTTLYAQWCSYESGSFVIKDVDDLWAFFSYSNYASDKTTDVKLNADISEVKDWIPNVYKGTFNGNNKSISYVSLKSSDLENAGFISDLAGGEVKNLTIKNSTISTTNTAGYAGAIAGTVSDTSAKITNCGTNKVSVTGIYAGLIAGKNEGTISGANIDGTLTTSVVTGTICAGGITGWNTGTVSSCVVDGIKVTTPKSSSAKQSSVGGVVGFNAADANITSLEVNSIKVEDGGYSYRVAGIAGYNKGTVDGAKINNSTITGNKTYAYTDEIAVGVDGTITNTDSTNKNNTVTGNRKVLSEWSYYEHPANKTETYDIQTVYRTANLRLQLEVVNGYTYLFLQKNGASDNLYSTPQLNDGSKVDEVIELLSTYATNGNKYTFKIQNKNSMQKAKGYFSLEVD